MDTTAYISKFILSNTRVRADNNDKYREPLRTSRTILHIISCVSCGRECAKINNLTVRIKIL